MKKNIRKKAASLITAALLICSAAYADTISDLFEEFNRRDAILLTPQQAQALNFLKVFKGFTYEVSDIIELEVFEEDSNRFIFRTRSGDICLGHIADELLRCKNEMGITVVNFTGDSD